MNFETLSFEQQGPIGWLKLNRPKALNALNRKLIEELTEFFEDIHRVENLRCLVLTGEGDKAFVAGADIKEMDGMDSSKAFEMAQSGQRLFQMIEDCPIPTIAAVNGFALGGGLELAMACDFIIATEKAKMGLPEVSLGLIPGYGGTQRLARYVGKAKAKLVTLTGDVFSAQQFYEWGLVGMITPPEELSSQVMKIAESISSRAPKALAWAKKSIVDGFDMPQKEGMELEARNFSMTFNTEDQTEGISAFIEKRKPQFKGL